MNDEKQITHIDLFSGIGGLALAADRVWPGIKHIFCDNELFAQEVLKKHWPTSPIFGEIRTLTNARGKKSRGLSSEQRKAMAEAREGGVFILTGGFPCQPFSQAGRRRGEEDDRFLWPEMCRVIGEFKPTWVIAENVRGLLTQGGGVVFERVCTDLEALGYEVQPLVIPAVAVGAPHRRDRVWFVAHAERGGLATSTRARSAPTAIPEEPARQDDAEHATGADSVRDDGGFNHGSCCVCQRCRKLYDDCTCDTSDATGSGWRKGHTDAGGHSKGARAQKKRARLTNDSWREPWLEVATRLCRVDDGIPKRLDRNPRLKALGNAIVPQVAEEIMRAIRASHH